MQRKLLQSRIVRIIHTAGIVGINIILVIHFTILVAGRTVRMTAVGTIIVACCVVAFNVSSAGIYGIIFWSVLIRVRSPSVLM